MKKEERRPFGVKNSHLLVVCWMFSNRLKQRLYLDGTVFPRMFFRVLCLAFIWVDERFTAGISHEKS